METGPAQDLQLGKPAIPSPCVIPRGHILGTAEPLLGEPGSDLLGSALEKAGHKRRSTEAQRPPEGRSVHGMGWDMEEANGPWD